MFFVYGSEVGSRAQQKLRFFRILIAQRPSKRILAPKLSIGGQVAWSTLADVLLVLSLKTVANHSTRQEHVWTQKTTTQES